MNQLVLSVQEFNTVLSSLAKLPWEQADPIISFLRGIATKQVEEAKKAEFVAD
jgi:hypothetical protein